MKRVAKFLLILFGLVLLAAVAACTSTGTTSTTLTDGNILLTAQAANPLPTEMAGQGLKVVTPKVCQVQQFVTIGTNSDFVNDPQGDSMAWNPVSNELAYLRPVNGRWEWFVGDLVVYDFALKKEVYTTTDLEVFGDLTWSTDGTDLAYVVLNPEEKVYTVYVGGLTRSLNIDIFGSSAGTDEYSSAKGISEWQSPTNLVVTSSCGLDCSRLYNYNTETGVLTKQNEIRKIEDSSLTLVNQNTSPDNNWSVFMDQKDNLWLSNADKGSAFIISTGVTVYEVKWSADSKYLALRFADSIKVLNVTCK